MNTVTNALGAFAYNYTNATARLNSVVYPNGQTTTFGYYGHTGDQRLQEIKNLDPSANVLSKFNYSYNAVGNITEWIQEPGPVTGISGAQSYAFGYDGINQLTNSVLTGTVSGNTTNLAQYAYRYDAMGNRTNESVSGTGVSPVGTVAGYNELNQLTTLLSSNPPPRHFRGTVSEDATVTINGQAATVSNKVFEANVSLQAGTNTVTIAANAEGRHQTNRYQVVEGGKSFTYDANGNLVSNGVTGAMYEWDAANRLLAIQSGTCVSPVIRSEFTYDGYSLRVRQVEKTWSNAQWLVTSEKRLLWLGTDIAEERSSSNNVTKRYFSQGVSVLRSQSSVFDPFFYTRDHLGSIRELTDTNGTIRARYAYDPWGRRTRISGDMEADFGFTGHYFHAPSGLHLALYRAYDAELGRWISRDPIEEIGGLNLYGYVANDSIAWFDPEGLASVKPPKPPKSPKPGKWKPPGPWPPPGKSPDPGGGIPDDETPAGPTGDGSQMTVPEIVAELMDMFNLGCKLPKYELPEGWQPPPPSPPFLYAPPELWPDPKTPPKPPELWPYPKPPLKKPVPPFSPWPGWPGSVGLVPTPVGGTKLNIPPSCISYPKVIP